jgi:hypothetical protein
LVEVLNLDQTADLLDAELDSTRIGSLLSTYNFQRLHPESLCTVELEESIIPPGVPILLTEVKIKQRGEIWFVYKNNADPFPSNPHAHNYDRGLKMHSATVTCTAVGEGRLAAMSGGADCFSSGIE